MAIIGGAGNPVGGSFTGAAEALEIVGDHAYGYSGLLDISTEADMLNFRTGNFYFVGTVQFNYVEAAGEVFQYRFYLNNSVVQSYIDYGGSTAANQTISNLIEVIIPPYTEVKATAANIQDSTARVQICSMAGRIYRTSD